MSPRCSSPSLSASSSLKEFEFRSNDDEVKFRAIRDQIWKPLANGNHLIAVDGPAPPKLKRLNSALNVAAMYRAEETQTENNNEEYHKRMILDQLQSDLFDGGEAHCFFNRKDKPGAIDNGTFMDTLMLELEERFPVREDFHICSGNNESYEAVLHKKKFMDCVSQNIKDFQGSLTNWTNSSAEDIYKDSISNCAMEKLFSVKDAPTWSSKNPSTQAVHSLNVQGHVIGFMPSNVNSHREVQLNIQEKNEFDASYINAIIKKFSEEPPEEMESRLGEVPYDNIRPRMMFPVGYFHTMEEFWHHCNRYAEHTKEVSDEFKECRKIYPHSQDVFVKFAETVYDLDHPYPKQSVSSPPQIATYASTKAEPSASFTNENALDNSRSFSSLLSLSRKRKTSD